MCAAFGIGARMEVVEGISGRGSSLERSVDVMKAEWDQHLARPEGVTCKAVINCAHFERQNNFSEPCLCPVANLGVFWVTRGWLLFTQ
jgi:hypothetical protein